jgi:hypothetical protein
LPTRSGVSWPDVTVQPGRGRTAQG